MSTRRLMEELRRQVGASRPNFQRRPTRAPAPAAPPRPTPSTPRSGGAAQPGLDPQRGDQATRDPALLERLKASTPAKVGVGRSGLRYRTETLLQFLVDFSIAQAAVESQVPEGWAEQQGWLPLQTQAADPEQFLSRPDLGRQLNEASVAQVGARLDQRPDVQIVVGDGLSANAVLLNAPAMVQALVPLLTREGHRVGTPVFVRHCRAKIMDVIGEQVQAKVGIILIGERPGLGTGDGMSAYLTWEPRLDRTDAERQAISNVHGRGLLPEEAGAHAARLIEAILTQRTSGVGLDASGIKLPQPGERPRINQAHPEPGQGCGQSHGQQCEAATDGQPGEVCNLAGDDRPCLVGTH
jgi:ethanolamine ammonia-lyase small subunit